MENKKQKQSTERPRKFTGEAAKVVLIKGADKSILGKDSVVTDKESELEWNKHPQPRKPGQ
jgi:NAD(P)H-hydrate repair Nnr-like enzyme with NAD(P)H-hydrate dehydratase domain